MSTINKTTVVLNDKPQNTQWSIRGHIAVAGILAVWLGGAIWAAQVGVFDAPQGSPPTALLLAILIPVAIFVVATIAWPGLKQAAISIHPILLNGVQTYRIIGSSFLIAMAFGELPAAFAWPAGLGDIAVGIGALFVLRRLTKNPQWIQSPRYLAFHLLGLADFVLAVSAGTIVSIMALNDEMARMNQAPLVLIPGFLVPLFAILHIIALMQRKARRQIAPHQGTES